jgi:hypothetical protein
MKIKTVQKLIILLKKEIDNLLATKSSVEERITEEENALESLKRYFKEELELATKERVVGFESSVFIAHELRKQSQKESEINLLNQEKNDLIDQIINKNIDKKTYEHILKDILAEAKLMEEKSEMDIIDTYSLIAFNKMQES